MRPFSDRPTSWVEGNRLPSVQRKAGPCSACGVRTVTTAVKIRLGPGGAVGDGGTRNGARREGICVAGSLRAHKSVPSTGEHHGTREAGV